MELTPSKISIIELALNSRIAELNNRIECFERAIAEGEGKYERALERSRKHLNDAIELLKEVEGM